MDSRNVTHSLDGDTLLLLAEATESTRWQHFALRNDFAGYFMQFSGWVVGKVYQTLIPDTSNPLVRQHAVLCMRSLYFSVFGPN